MTSVFNSGSICILALTSMIAVVFLMAKGDKFVEEEMAKIRDSWICEGKTPTLKERQAWWGIKLMSERVFSAYAVWVLVSGTVLIAVVRIYAEVALEELSPTTQILNTLIIVAAWMFFLYTWATFFWGVSLIRALSLKLKESDSKKEIKTG